MKYLEKSAAYYLSYLNNPVVRFERFTIHLENLEDEDSPENISRFNNMPGIALRYERIANLCVKEYRDLISKI